MRYENITKFKAGIFFLALFFHISAIFIFEIPGRDDWDE